MEIGQGLEMRIEDLGYLFVGAVVSFEFYFRTTRYESCYLLSLQLLNRVKERYQDLMATLSAW